MRLARNGTEDFRRPDEEGSDEAQGSHYQQEEARPGQEGLQEPGEGRLQAEEGHVQAVQEVNNFASLSPRNQFKAVRHVHIDACRQVFM
jgi:hypothetical protein